MRYYNFGSMDGAPRTNSWIQQGQNATFEFVYELSRGIPVARPLPQIYNAAYAKEWYHLSYYSFTRKGTPLQIAGVLTECATSGCNNDFDGLQTQSWPLYRLDLLNQEGIILDFAPRQGWLALWDTLHRTQIQDMRLPASLRLTDGFVFTIERRPQFPQLSTCQPYVIPTYPDGRLPEPNNRFAPDQYVDDRSSNTDPQPSCLPTGTVFPESSTFSSQFALPVGTAHFFNPLTEQDLPWSTDIDFGSTP